MNKNLVKSIVILIFLIYMNGAFAKSAYTTIIDSGTESTIIQMASNARQQAIGNKPFGEIMQWVAYQMLGKPYVGALLDKKTPEYLFISTEQTGCMLFMEHVFIISKLIQQNRLDINNLTDGIAKVRYHGNVSYCTRNHYFKDWIISNSTQLQNVSESLAGINYP